jgi:hypothetical protein
MVAIDPAENEKKRLVAIYLAGCFGKQSSRAAHNATDSTHEH